MIKLQNISFAYGNKAILQDLNLQLESNKITCLLGSSGCGKTTILRLIAGLETPKKGSISIDDEILSKNSKILVKAQNRNLGFIFQDLALWPHFTVFQNIAFGLKEGKEQNISEKVQEMLSFFELNEQADKYPHQLSGGQQQLLAIARSLVLKPQILLMDEPLSNLDVKLKRKILEHILKIKQEFELSIIYVTHDHKEAFAIADHVVVLEQGKIQAQGSVEDIKKSNNEFVKYFLEY